MAIPVVPPSLTRNLKILTSTLTAIALLLTVYRMACRYATRRLWWEDACAVLAFMGGVICVVTSWLYFELVGQPSVISIWIHALTYPCVVWSVRLSILLSILRIMSPSRNLRRVMIFIAGLFVLMWCSIMITFVTRCVSGHRFYIAPNQQDGEGIQSLAIYELITDILSDCPLIILPIHSLRSIKLLRSRRRLIIAAFSSSILVIVVSLFRAVSQLLNIFPFINVAIDVQVACSLFVCNSLFITTLIYRVLHRYGVISDANTNFPNSHSPSTPNSTLQLTTVLDLDVLISIASGSISTDGPAMTCPGDDAEKNEKYY